MNQRTGCGSRSSPTGREHGASRRTPPSCWPTQHKHNSRQHLAQENNDGAPDHVRLCPAGLEKSKPLHMKWRMTSFRTFPLPGSRFRIPRVTRERAEPSLCTFNISARL